MNKKVLISIFVLVLITACSDFDSCMSTCKKINRKHHYYNSTCSRGVDVIKEEIGEFMGNDMEAEKFSCNRTNFTSLEENCFEECNK